MHIHETIVAAATLIADAFPAVKKYDMEGNLHLVVQTDDQNGPHSYNMNGKMEPRVNEQIFKRNSLLEAAGIACCFH